MFSVRDTGHGMDQATISRIFDPFYSTKEVGKGTGLGLSISYGIVKDCGGTIEAHPHAPHGTCFVLRFPRIDETVTATESKTGHGENLNG